MSTPGVRDTLIAEIEQLAAPCSVFNLSDYVSVDDLPVGDSEQCVLLDFVASSERIASIGDPDNLGFEETGTVAIHWLAPRGFASGPVLTAAETVRKNLRGRRISNIVVESVEPFADSGSPIDEKGRWTGFSSLLFYSLYSFQ